MFIEFTRHSDNTLILINSEQIAQVEPVFSHRATFTDILTEVGANIYIEGNLRIHVSEKYKDVVKILKGADNGK